MKRSFHLFAAAAALALGASLAAQNVPEIAYDANADLLKLPDNIHLGEAAGVATNSKGHIFVYTRTGAAHATLGTSRTFYKAGSRLFEFDQTGKFVREIGVGVYGFNSAQAVRIDPQDNIWVVDQGSTQVIKFDPDGRIQLVLSRKPEAIAVRAGAPGGGPGRGAPPEGRGGTAGRARRRSAAASGWSAGRRAAWGSGRRRPRSGRTSRRRHPRRQLRPHRGRRVGRAGQHLRRRRLRQRHRQRARREVRQGRALHQVVGPARHRAGAVQLAARHRDRRQGQRLRRRRRQQADPGVRRRRQPEGADRQRRRPGGDLHHAGRAPVHVRLELERRRVARQRRDLQDGARRQDRRQVRPRRPGAEGVQHGERDRLPQRERAASSASSATGACRS